MTNVPITQATPAVLVQTNLPARDLASTPASVESLQQVPAQVVFNPAELWLGVMVPKRWAKRAVTRNLIKRQTYTVSAQLANKLPLGAFVVRLRSEFSRRDFASAASEALKLAVRDEVQALLHAGAQR